jgi:hypothetical protein
MESNLLFVGTETNASDGSHGSRAHAPSAVRNGGVRDLDWAEREGRAGGAMQW